ncbi:MAG: O-methyltransferase [Henriciella sp.]|uniref:O-methyltransferase n=1 Tax=Henriciella sp. TaxID=1968823 RepID=UPI003C7070EE
MDSFRKINYSIRPAKHAERRMVAEIIRRLHVFAPLEQYEYVGMGSLWFTDFSLFHRLFGLKKMVSIEGATHAQARVEANKPFSSIEIRFEKCSTALPALDWDSKKIVWLDYDSKLQPDVLSDVGTVATRAANGSLLCTTTNCDNAPELQEDDSDLSADDQFRAKFGAERIPEKFSELDLYGWRYGALSRQMIMQEIEEALIIRNAGSDNKLKYESVAAIEYTDGAKMSTEIGVFVDTQQTDTYEKADFGSLDFLHSDKPVRIEVPPLTIREIRAIERHLPTVDASVPKSPDYIPEADRRRFSAFYRYLPNFVVLEG